MEDRSVSFEVPPKVRESISRIEGDGRKVQIVGQLKHGKVELDAAALNELERRFPGAHMSFVAVNAPFVTALKRS